MTSTVLKTRAAAWLIAGLAGAPLSLALAQSARQPAPFTAAQATAGKAAYDKSCAGCHGVNLEGAGPAVTLKGTAFLGRYGGEPVEKLFTAVRRMPPAGGVDAATSVNILAFLLQQNGGTAGARELPGVTEAQTGMVTPGGAAAGQAALINILPKPGPSALDRLRPVTEADLAAPPPSDWLNWRRTRDVMGFSPLAQINAGNVKSLQTAWTWSLPKGANMMAPIVRDGVLFAYSSGDIVEALDATNGQLLWRHQRRLDPGSAYTSKKGVAIAGDRLIVPTSDAHVLALDFKSGRVLWDNKIDTGGETGVQIKSAPLIVGDKAIIGLNGFAGVKGGNFLLAIDLKTGRELWRFYTIARPGEPGGDTWNGIPLKERNGGSVWDGASYDAKTNLIYFGAAPSYSADALRKKSDKPGISNEGLYTNSTIALNADTGKLAWFFQHQSNDQIDLDWVFERQLFDINVDGKMRRVVVTAGKEAIYEALDAATAENMVAEGCTLQVVPEPHIPIIINMKRTRNHA